MSKASEQERAGYNGAYLRSQLPKHAGLRQEDRGFQDSVGYILKPFLKTRTNGKQQER